MGKEAIKTDGGTWIKVDTDKNGKRHVDVYDDNPRDPHDESIHITIKPDGSGTITTKSGGNPRETTDTKCYLTTACMKYYLNNFADDCYELTVLRWFRDNFVSENDIKHYYNIAPFIVDGIEDEENKNIIYDYIYDNVVDYCVEQIEFGNYEEAYKRYSDSILFLEKLYAKKVLNHKLIKTLNKNY